MVPTPVSSTSRLLLDHNTAFGRNWSADFLPSRTFVGGCFVAGLVLQSRPALGQDALRNYMSQSSSTPAVSNPVSLPEGQPYTFKSGDFRLIVSPSLDASWNDNVYLTQTGREDDYILRPTVGFGATYPLTDKNLLSLNFSVGYSYYLNHHDLSAFYLASGSQLSFDVFVGDFQFNFHDYFSYTQDSSTEPAVSDTGSYGTFQNTTGVSGTWNYGDVNATLSYDHQFTEATQSQFDQVDQSSELFVVRLGFNVFPHITLGTEATGTIMVYQQQSLNNNNGWSGGVYGTWAPDSAFSITPRFGYTVSYYQQTSTLTTASDQSSWYADLTVTHQPFRFLSYTLSAGHELQGGIESDAVEDDYVRPTLNWSFIRNVNISTPFSYEYGSQRGGEISTAYGQVFRYYNAGVTISCSPVKRINTSLYYLFTDRSGSSPEGIYTQNIIGMTLAYALP